MKVFITFFLLSLTITLRATPYTTPNTGVDWTMNDLVVNSNGSILGSYPNYTILDSLTISPNDRLSIMPGSRLIFTLNGILIRGKFLAIGTSNEPIYFTGATQAPASWRNIRIEDSAIDSACIFRYVVLEYSTGGISCINSSPTIEYSTLRFNGSLTSVGGSTAIQCFNSNAIIRNDSIYNNSQNAITISNTSNPIIEYNYFANNNVRNVSPVNPITINFQGNNNPIIRFNEIHSADIPEPVRAGGISVGLGSNTTFQNPLIEGNYIHDCAFGIVVGGASTAILKDNRIINNNRNPNPSVAGSGININSSGSAIAAPIIVGNFIKGNLWGVTIQGTAQPNLGDLSNASIEDDGRNTFLANLQGSTNYALFNNTNNFVSAQNNYWSTTNIDSIQAQIWGVGDINNPSTINVLPISLFDISLPVELSMFYYERHPMGILIKWVTSSEVENDGFVIERRSNEEAIHSGGMGSLWQSLGFVQGNGTTTSAQFYSFLDKTAIGKIAYRLKQIDFNGTAHYSHVVELDAGLPAQFELSQNYPNPFNPSTLIRYQLPISSTVKLELFDLLGKKIATLVNAKQNAGVYSVSLVSSMYSMSSGIYFYRLQTNSTTLTKKMMLIK